MSKTKKNKYTPYETILQVKWRDATSNAEWHDKEKVDKLLETAICDRMLTVGYFIQDNDDWILLADTIDPADKMISNYFIIPKACIMKIVVLKKDNKND